MSMIRMRLVLALAALLLAAPPTQATEAILHFDSAVTVTADASLAVTETIRVHAEGREIRRGIYRDFPLTFLDNTGDQRTVPFTPVEVRRDGRPEPHFTERRGNRIRIYAGSKEANVAPGEHTYVFRYRTSRQVRWFDGAPELNWNVTGNFWNFPILAATYRVKLPDGARPSRWTAFTGRPGARHGLAWRDRQSQHPYCRNDAGTRAGRGLTVVVDIPQGAARTPSLVTMLYYSYLDYKRWIFGGLGVLAALAYYLAAWNTVGRDPKRGIVILQFHPPNNVSPALANYISGWGFRDRWRAFTAAALSLAIKGLRGRGVGGRL